MQYASLYECPQNQPVAHVRTQSMTAATRTSPVLSTIERNSQRLNCGNGSDQCVDTHSIKLPGIYHWRYQEWTATLFTNPAEPDRAYMSHCSSSQLSECRGDHCVNNTHRAVS